MENKDIFNQIKAAADHAETPHFASMDKVWNRVEEKLDQDTLKNEKILWKKWAVAASILLLASIGYQFIATDNSKTIVPNQPTVSTPTPTESSNHEELVTSDQAHPVLKENATEILKQQLKSDKPVALNDDEIRISTNQTDSISSNQAGAYITAAPFTTSTWSNANSSAEVVSNRKNVEVFVGKENKAKMIHKEAPLVVIDDEVVAKKELEHLDLSDAESIEVLNDPLYIINGIYYTEQQLFGPNPTSPYTPLNQQNIESLTILQQEKAVELYGEKGKKGVVIISTKDGKPVKATRPNTSLMEIKTK